MGEKQKRERYRSPDRMLAMALRKAEQFAEDGALASIADKRLLAVRIKALQALSARSRRDTVKKLHEELATKDVEIERVKTEAPAPTVDTGELQNAQARIEELVRENAALRRSASQSRPADDEKMKAYGYLIDCVAAIGNLPRETRLVLFKHVIDVSGVPTWKAGEFERLLGWPRNSLPLPEPTESVKPRPAAQVTPVAPPKVYPTIAEMEEAIVVKQRELDALLRRNV